MNYQDLWCWMQLKMESHIMRPKNTKQNGHGMYHVCVVQIDRGEDLEGRQGR
jgi:hypothetical protein